MACSRLIMPSKKWCTLDGREERNSICTGLVSFFPHYPLQHLHGLSLNSEVLNLWPVGQMQPSKLWNLACGAPYGLGNLVLPKFPALLGGVELAHNPPSSWPDWSQTRPFPRCGARPLTGLSHTLSPCVGLGWGWMKPLPHSWSGLGCPLPPPTPSACPDLALLDLACVGMGHCLSSSPAEKGWAALS